MEPTLPFSPLESLFSYFIPQIVDLLTSDWVKFPHNRWDGGEITL
jgi:hypothetical protein